MKKSFLGILVGIATSILSGYIYAYLIKINFPFVYVVGMVLVVSSMIILVYSIRSKIYLILSSGILGYFPKGQDQYAHKAVREILDSKEVIIVGARGMDLIGENSPFSKALHEAKNLSKVEMILLKPGGKHSRLRSDHLEVDRKKYEAESLSVENYIGVLKIHDGINVTKYSYTTRPVLRMIVTDNSAFLSFYKSGIKGRDLPCWHVSRKSVTLFVQITKYIDDLKKNSIEQVYTDMSIDSAMEVEDAS